VGSLSRLELLMYCVWCYMMIIACKNCHGITGKGKEPHNPTFSVIGGQRKEHLLKQLASFRKGDRDNSLGGVMNITVQQLNDAEIESLADYISGL
jgi:cytochrome c553